MKKQMQQVPIIVHLCWLRVTTILGKFVFIGQTGVNMPRMKLDLEFTPEETNRENADTQPEIILSQGLPRHIFNILNQTNTAKEIWDNVEMLMQGSGMTLQKGREIYLDEFETISCIGNEPILWDYFVRFHKLMNDMKITQLAIPTHQLNTKFVNNLPSYWGKYVTNVKQNMDISTTNYVHIYTHRKSTIGASCHKDSQETRVRRVQGMFGNTGSRANSCYGNVTTTTGKKYFKDKMLLIEAKEKGATLDTKAEAFLANVECTAPYDQPLVMTTTNIFEVNHEDAYDSDVDEGPNAAAAFLAICHQQCTNGRTEQSDSVFESELDANTTPLSSVELLRNGKAKVVQLSYYWVYWLPANKIASQASTPSTPVTPYVPKSPHPSQVLATLHNIKAVFPQFDAIIKERTTVKPLYVSLPCYEYAKEFALQQVNYVSLQLKFQNYKQCSDTSSASNAIFEINKLRDQLQGKDATIRNLDSAQINITEGVDVGVKPTSGANKPVPKRAPQNHSSLPAKSTKREGRVDPGMLSPQTLKRITTTNHTKNGNPLRELGNPLRESGTTLAKILVPKGFLVVKMVLGYLDSGCLTAYVSGDRAAELSNFDRKLHQLLAYKSLFSTRSPGLWLSSGVESSEL
ncbi:hypothetical protein Tco_0431048 [Tanacetum coccineum]